MILDAVHSLTTGVIVLLAIAFFLGFVLALQFAPTFPIDVVGRREGVATVSEGDDAKSILWSRHVLPATTGS